MRLGKKFARSTRQVFFLLDIDFNYRAQEILGKLEAGHSYNISELGRISNRPNRINYSDIVDFITNIVNTELKSQCQECIGIPVEQVRVLKTYKGSIKVIFSVIFSALGVVSGLKDLYDCIELIKVIANAHIKNRLEDQYGDLFDTSIRTISSDRDRFYHKSGKQECLMSTKCSNRDAFFYYLLVSNIVLLVVIGFLVYKAVLTMYW